MVCATRALVPPDDPDTIKILNWYLGIRLKNSSDSEPFNSLACANLRTHIGSHPRQTGCAKQSKIRFNLVAKSHHVPVILYLTLTSNSERARGKRSGYMW
jgi:hypothetical protein